MTDRLPESVTIDERIVDLEHQLIEFADRPRVAQIQRVKARTELENRLAELRQQRDEQDEPLDAA